jgi:hypothetical protein
MSFFIEAWLDEALGQIQKREGIPKAQSIRNAITAYVVDRGFSPKRMMAQAAKSGGGKKKKRL